MDADAFEAGLRRGEWFHSLTVPQGMWTVLRVDGRGFSKLTQTAFDKPFDPTFRDHMIAVSTALMRDFDAVYTYTESDEASVLLPASFDGFGRSLEKLVSLSAGVASSAFTLSAARAVHFDSRVWIGASLSDVVDYFSWRQADAAGSALNNWCYWTLRNSGQTARQATAALNGLMTSAKHDLLFGHGINFAEVPAWQRRGIGLWWRNITHVGFDPRSGDRVPAVRRRLHVEQNLPMKREYRQQVSAIATRFSTDAPEAVPD